MFNYTCVETTGRRDDIIQRIYGNVTVKDCGHDTPCYLWNGQDSGPGETNGRGYPRMTLNGQTVAVHRVVYTHFEGYIPSKKQVDHLCRSRRCVRYEHLEMVTHKENCKRRDQANGVVRKKRKVRKQGQSSRLRVQKQRKSSVGHIHRPAHQGSETVGAGT